MRKLIHILISLILIGVMVWACADDTQKSEGHVTRIIDYRKLPIVQATLNQKTAYFILDTGATISVLDVSEAAKYGVKRVGTSEIGVVGYGGVDNINYILGNYNIVLGDIKLRQEFQGKDISLIVDFFRQETGRKIVGIIGNNNISDRKLVLDFNRGEIRR